MSGDITPKSIDRLLAEADELVQQINADALKDLKEEHRLQVQKHAQHIKRIKSEVQAKIEKEKTSGTDHGAEGMHEAIQEITRAVGALAKYLS